MEGMGGGSRNLDWYFFLNLILKKENLEHRRERKYPCITNVLLGNSM